MCRSMHVAGPQSDRLPPCSLEALSALSGLRELRAAGNRLTSLGGIQGLAHLTLLDLSSNQLQQLPSLAGLYGGHGGAVARARARVPAMASLTRRIFEQAGSCCSIKGMPRCRQHNKNCTWQPVTHCCIMVCAAALSTSAGLTALRRLDLSGNQLTSAGLAATGLAACGGARLTSLCLSGNRLTDLASWMGPLPSLLHMDVGGNAITGLQGLAQAAPLLQVCSRGMTPHRMCLCGCAVGAGPGGRGGCCAWGVAACACVCDCVCGKGASVAKPLCSPPAGLPAI